MTDDLCGSTNTSGDPCKWNVAEKGECPFHNTDDPPESGRPSKCNESLIDDFISLIQDGCSISMASEEVGVTEQSIHNWLNRGVSEEGTIYAKLKERFDAVWYDEYDHEKHCRKIKSEHYSGKDAEWVWKGGRRDYRGPNWHAQRQKALERAMYRCESCGMAGEEHQQKYDRGLHVHHIIARRNFANDDPEQNKLDNLCVLCHQCHEIYEGTNLSPVERANA